MSSSGSAPRRRGSLMEKVPSRELSIDLVADEWLGWNPMLVRVMESAKRLAAFPQCKMTRLALFCHPGMSAVRSILGEKRKWRGHAKSVVHDPEATWRRRQFVVLPLAYRHTCSA